MKVFVSGIGIVSGIGLNVAEHIESFRAYRHGMGPVTLFQTRHAVPVSEVKATNEQLKELAGITDSKSYSRSTLLGIVAAKQAWEEAAIDISKGWRIGLISSTSNGGMDLSEQFYTSFHTHSSKGRLRDIIHHDAGDSTEEIASYLGLDGFRTTVSTACSSAANAILLGSRLIEQNILDIVIAGGTDALCKFTLNGFNSLMILTNELTRPFDENRAGLNLGEGAGYLVLQSGKTLTHTPCCYLAGYGNANDAYHQTASSEKGKGARLAMRKALKKARLKPEDIDYINAHGTGTPNNDASESRAICDVFKKNIPTFSSTKCFTGHTLGAAGALEAVFSVLTLKHGLLYSNFTFRSPILKTGLIPQLYFKEGEHIQTVLSNSFGFGGNNTTLIFKKITGRFNPTYNRKKAGDLQESKIYINAIASNYELHTTPEGTSELSLINCQPDKTIVSNPTVRRRMSRIIRMGVTTGLECLKNAGNSKPDAILTATGLGCLADTEKFMNNLLDNDEELLNPTAFIQSTFNTVGAQIALLTQNHCYNTTYVHRGLSLESAFTDAISLLKENPSQNILCGSIEELTPTLSLILKRLGNERHNKPGEGTAFYLLSGEKKEETYACLEAVETFTGQYTKQEIESKITGFLTENNCLNARIIRHEQFKRICGEFPTAVSFALWNTLSEVKEKNLREPVLIYNQYMNNHSLILLTPV